ncbi:MAG TPA: hypothetical protein VF584_26505 [Longimicrobium sp.]|jgi:hypothetical protein
MSLSLLRTATAAAALTLAAASGAHAQEAFAATDPIGATTEAAAPQGVVLKLDGAASEATLHEFLATSHAGWLAGRGAHDYSRRNHVMVYRDGVLVGAKAALRSIKMGDVAEVRRLSPAEASERFGLDHGAGAILITSR